MNIKVVDLICNIVLFYFPVYTPDQCDMVITVTSEFCAALISLYWCCYLYYCNCFFSDEHKKKEEERQHGIFFDDDYNYLQHLKPRTNFTLEPLPDNVTVIEAKKTSDHVEVSCIFSDFTVNNTLPFHHKLISLNILLMLKLTEFDLILFF